MPVWPTLIIVSGWEWYGLAEKCNVLPFFYILNSGSHEPLQGDASSDFKRNFNLDAPCYLSPSEPSNVKTAPAFPFFFFLSNIGIGTILRSGTASGASGGGGGGGGGSGHSGECRLAVSPAWHRPLPIADTRYSIQHFPLPLKTKTHSLPCWGTASLFAYLTEPSLNVRDSC